LTFARRLAPAIAAGTAALSLGLPHLATAAIYTVTTPYSSGTGSLAQALAQAQSDPAATINLQTGLDTITLTAPLPAIENNLVINGNNDIINGTGTFRIFFINAPGDSVQINNLTLSDGLALGGPGGGAVGGGGGGAGLGGAIFVNAGAVTVSGVTFSGNTAHGGTGGLGFASVFEQTAGGGGGGGGLAFGGGSPTGGSIDDGDEFEAPGGGGGALTSAGQSVSGADSPGGGMGGGVHGGMGGADGLEGSAGGGASPTLPDGGGGGGGLALQDNGGNGGNGSDFGGGGGAGSSDSGNAGTGGNGGFGGGGGGGAFTFGGTGYPGGNGGFGGGGGGGGYGTDGSGDFTFGAAGTGGFGGGNGASGGDGYGGGGLGAGGAIFARLGSSLTIQDSSFGGDAVIGGGGAYSGGASGQAVFLGANVNFSVSTGTNTLAETIGGGNDPNAAGGFIKSGAGTLVLANAESYSGATTVSNGTLAVVNNLLPSTAVAISPGAVLEYNFSSRTLTPNTTFTGGGTLRATGSGKLVFGPGLINVDFSPGALIDVASGTLTGSSSYGGIWTANQASLNIASNAVFDAVEAGSTGTMQIDALTGAGTFQGGYVGNLNSGLTTVTIGIAGGSGTFGGTLQNDASARLGIVKTGPGTETFSGSNTHTGGTTVAAGTLVINGTNGPGAVSVTGGILGGTGTIGGPVSIGAGGTLVPGSVLAPLTINNTLNLAGNTLISLNSGVSSSVTGLTSVTYGGTLTITNLGAALAVGNTFNLFSAASSSGNFTSLVGHAGPGQVFSFNPASGVLSVQGILPNTPTNLSFSISAGALKLNWPASYTGWILQVQTNQPASGLSNNWVDVPGSSAVDSLSFGISHADTVFFRLRLP